MSSRRFPGTELTEWRSRLVDRHAGLFPDARPVWTEVGWILVCSGWPAVPDGWRRVVEDACCEIERAIPRGSDGEAVIVDMDHKYGTLRFTVSTLGLGPEAHEAVMLAAELAEARSGHTCEVCGEPGRRWDNGGWLSTLCDAHGQGRPIPHGPGEGDEITTRFENGRAIHTARRYLPREHRFISVPVAAQE